MSGNSTLTRADFGSALLVVVIWGLNFVTMKFGLRDLTPMMLGALRFTTAALPLVLILKRPNVPWSMLVAYGMAQGVGQFGLLFLGLKLGMTAGMASLIMQMQAFFTMVLTAVFLGERARPLQWLGLSIAGIGLVGIAIAHGDGPKQMTLIGFCLTLSAALMWAVSNLIVRTGARRGATYEPLAFIGWSSLVSVVPFVLLGCALDGPSSVLESLSRLRLTSVLSVLYLGWFATLLAYSLWTNLLKRYPAAKVAPYSLLVPVIGIWAAGTVFDEWPTPLQWLGTGLILIGLVVNQLPWRPARPRNACADHV